MRDHVHTVTSMTSSPSVTTFTLRSAHHTISTSLSPLFPRLHLLPSTPPYFLSFSSSIHTSFLPFPLPPSTPLSSLSQSRSISLFSLLLHGKPGAFPSGTLCLLDPCILKGRGIRAGEAGAGCSCWGGVCTEQRRRKSVGGCQRFDPRRLCTYGRDSIFEHAQTLCGGLGLGVCVCVFCMYLGGCSFV